MKKPAKPKRKWSLLKKGKSKRVTMYRKRQIMELKMNWKRMISRKWVRSQSNLYRDSIMRRRESFRWKSRLKKKMRKSMKSMMSMRMRSTRMRKKTTRRMPKCNRNPTSMTSLTLMRTMRTIPHLTLTTSRPIRFCKDSIVLREICLSKWIVPSLSFSIWTQWIKPMKALCRAFGHISRWSI